MEKGKQSGPDIDVTDESYQGPPNAIVIAGHGSIEHLVFGVIGLFGFGLAALLAPAKAAGFVEKAKDAGERLRTINMPGEKKFLERFTAQGKRAWGGFLRGIFGDKEISEALKAQAEIFDKKEANTTVAEVKRAAELNQQWFESVATDKKLGFGSAFISHTLGMFPLVGKPIKAALRDANGRWSNAVTVGGLAGAMGYVGGWGKALLLGSVHGNTGKHQFERAKKQIKNLQEDNADLNKINDELHEKYVKAATRLDSIDAARDAASRSEASLADAPAPMNQAAAPNAEVQLDTAQHQGKLAQQDLVAAVA